MASKARFGRLPRSAPSLTSTIVALAQEYQRVRESNIVDAWKNGGQFEGKSVHDKDILAWMKARRDEVSPGDPKWDYYNNQVQQYDFAIENSKMELSYKQKKTSDAGMVAFYHKWASKLPPDSEAYREREKLAAAYADRAASGRAASGRAATDKAYAADINKDYKKEFAYNQTMAFVESEAHNRGILNPGEHLHNIDPNTADGHALTTLWDEIAHSPEYADYRAFYTKAIKKNGDPNFNGDFSQEATNGYARIAKGAINDRINTAKAAGRKGDVKSFTADSDTLRGQQILIGGVDEMTMYEDAHKEWLATFTDPNATPLEVDRANAKYTDSLTKVRDGLRANIKPGEIDDRLGAVNDELKTMAGDENPYQHWSGMFGPLANEGGSGATETAQGIKFNKEKIDNLSLRDANGDPLYLLMKTIDGVEPGAMTPDNNRLSKWGVVKRENVDPNAVFVIQGDPGDPRAGNIVTAVMPTPIKIVGDITAPDGTVSKMAAATPAAYHYTMPDGTVGYKYQDASGKWLYTPDNPFGPNANPKIDKDGGTVYVPGGNGTTVPTPSTAILPGYYNPSTNVAMTSRIAKSGYGMWLIASDPKHNAAYAEKPEDIIRTLKLEAGNDPARFAEMVVDADQRRAVYLGSSTEEQNRLRQNYYTGTPNPVGLTQMAGIKAPSAEQNMINELTAQPGTATAQDRAAIARQMAGAPDTTAADTMTLDEQMRGRRNTLAPGPDRAGPIPYASPTSLGSIIPANIAGSLVGIIQQVTGNGPNVPTGIRTPAQTGFSLTGTAPKPTAPQPAAPAPVAPMPTPPMPGPPPPPQHASTAAAYAASAPKTVNYNDPTVLRNQHGATEFG